MDPRRRYFAALAAAVCLGGGGSAAAGDDAAAIGLSGFGTLGAVWNDRAGTEFRRDISQPTGARGRQLSWAPDSLLGVQATARPGNGLEGAVQLISRNRIDAGYRPEVAWAFIKYSPAANLALRAGRLGIELYLQGDAADIGYANPTLRQPVVFIPRNYDGIDAETTLPVAGGLLRLKGMAGVTNGNSMYAGNVYDQSGSRLAAGLADLQWGGWTARLAGGRLTLAHELTGNGLEALRAALATTPNCARINDALAFENRRFDYLDLALAYDAGPWFGLADVTSIASPGWPTRYSYNAHAGYRLGKAAPYLAGYRRHSARATLPTGIPAGLSPATDALNFAAALAQGSSRFNETGVALGLRYELSMQTALKFQLDHIRYRNSENIVDAAAAAEPGETRGIRHLNLWSVALEFVF